MYILISNPLSFKVVTHEQNRVPIPLATTPHWRPRLTGDHPPLATTPHWRPPPLATTPHWRPPPTGDHPPLATTPHWRPRLTGDHPPLATTPHWRPPPTGDHPPLATTPHWRPRLTGDHASLATTPHSICGCGLLKISGMIFAIPISQVTNSNSLPTRNQTAMA